MKLNGVIASTNPSSGRYSIRFQVPGAEAGCSASSCLAKATLYRQEVDQLAGGVDLGLEHRFRLAEDRRGVQRRAPRPGEQVGRAQENGRAVVEGQRPPRLRRRCRGGDRLRHVRVGRVPEIAEYPPVIVRL